jgi:hydrogenase assembly chaperone HypC/HupF
MCQAAVGKVVKVDGKAITIEFNGKTRVLDSSLVEAEVGDYVQFSMGLAIDKIDEEEAKMILGSMA